MGPYSLTFFMLFVFLTIYIFQEVNHRKSSYYKITRVSYLRMRMDVGRLGEYMTYRHLRSYEKDGGKFLFNIYIPKGENGTTEIDVLLITRKGLFVFESKNYSGWIFGEESKPKWYQTLPQGKGKSHKESFYNPIMQNRTHIKHLQALLGETIPMYSIITFSDRCTLKKVEVSSPDVHVINRSSVEQLVPRLWAKNADTLSPAQIQAIYDQLYPYTQVDEAAKEKHIADIEQKAYRGMVKPAESVVIDQIPEIQPKEPEPVVETETNEAPLRCPKCGGELVLRTVKKGEKAGSQFYGCSNFPKCRYIQNK